MKMLPQNKYYCDQSYIFDKHDPIITTNIHTLFFKKQCFCTTKRATRVTHVFFKKHPFLHVFLVAHVYIIIPDCPPHPGFFLVFFPGSKLY